MSILIKNGLILTLDGQDSVHERGDILIQKHLITDLGPDLEVNPDSVDQIIDASDKLVMPGLINAHIHSEENFRFGLESRLPNEIWNLSIYPPFGSAEIGHRVCYLQTLLGAIAMVKGGTTSVQDHARGCADVTEDQGSKYFDAYLDIGMRLSVAVNIMNKPWHEMIPGLNEMLPEEYQQKTANAHSHWEMRSVAEVIADCESVIQTWHGHKGMVTVAVGPSAPQRCTDDLLIQAGDLARKYDVQLHMHALETRIQHRQSREQYSGSISRYLQDMGLLEPRLSIIHAIWLTEEDMQDVAEAECSIIHVPLSNLFMGSGVMPLTRFMEQRNTIALGTDGIEAGSFSMFETIKMTALLHRVTTPEYKRWPSARQVLHMATQGSAHSMGLQANVGRLSPGMTADVILLDLDSVSFTPLNDVVNQLVYSENGSSVNTVIINGHVVMSDRKLTTVDEQAILEEIRSYEVELFAAYQSTKAAGQSLFSVMDEIYRRSYKSDSNLPKA